MKPYDLSQYMFNIRQPSGADRMGYSATENYAAGTVGEAIKNIGTGGSGAGGAGVVTTSYVYHANVAAPPLIGEIRFDVAPPNAATAMRVHQTTTDGTDVGLAYSYLSTGQRVYIQDADDATRFIKAIVVAQPVDQGDWWLFPILVTEATVPSLLTERVTIGWPTSAAAGSGIAANVVPKGGGSGGLVASQFFDSGVNVGLGTTAPAAKLDVQGDVALADHSYIYTPYNGATNTASRRAGIKFDGDTQAINFVLGGAMAGYASGGRWGIGPSTALVAALDVNGATWPRIALKKEAVGVWYIGPKEPANDLVFSVNAFDHMTLVSGGGTELYAPWVALKPAGPAQLALEGSGFTGATNYMLRQSITGISNEGFSIRNTTAGRNDFWINADGSGGIAGDFKMGGILHTGLGLTAGQYASMEIGGQRTGDGGAYIDFVTVQGADYQTRMIRGAGVDGGLAISNGGTGNVSLVSEGAGSLTLATSNAPRIFINAAGDVGINNSAPAGKLHVQLADAAAPGANWNNTYAVFGKAGATGVAIGLGTLGNRALFVSLAPSVAWLNVENWGYDHKWFCSGTEAMKLSSVGNLLLKSQDYGARICIAAGGNGPSIPALGTINANSALVISNSDNFYGLNIVPASNGTVHFQSQYFNGTAIPMAMTFNSAGGFVGIGTTAPVAPLHVNAGTAQNTITAFFTAGGDNNFRLGTANGTGNGPAQEQGKFGLFYQNTPINVIGFHRGGSADGALMTFNMNGNEWLTLNSGGNMRCRGNSFILGADASGKMSVIGGGPSNTGYLEFTSADATRRGYIGYAMNPGHIQYVNENAPGYGHNFVGSVVLNSNTVLMGSGSNITKSDSTGSLNIGGGDALGTGGAFILRGNGQAEGAMNGGIEFWTMGQTRAVFNGSGQFIYGRRDAFDGVSALPVQVQWGIAINAPNNNPQTVMTFMNNQGPGNRVGWIGTQGDGTSYVTTSDERLKENIVDADSPGEVIDAIKVRSFDWKSDGTHQRWGTIAQELHTVAPEAVALPGEGDDPDSHWGVDYSKLVPLLVKELQDLRARVAYLEGYGQRS